MPEIQSPDPGRKLQEKYNLLGTTPAPFLSPELVPVVLIDDLTEESPGILFATAGENLNGVAGQQGQTALSNRAASGVLLTEIGLIISANAIAFISIWQAGPALSGAIVERFVDRRVPGVPAGVVTDGTDVGAVSNEMANQLTIASTPVRFDFSRWVLRPGDKIHALVESTNVNFSFWWTWGEVRT